MTAHDRAERALARALRDHDRDHDFAPLDPEGLKHGTAVADPPRRRGPWMGLVAAALVLVLAVPFGASLLSSMFNAGSSAPSFDARPANAPAAGGAPPIDQAAGGPEAAGKPASADDRPAPPPGWRWGLMVGAAGPVSRALVAWAGPGPWQAWQPT